MKLLLLGPLPLLVLLLVVNEGEALTRTFPNRDIYYADEIPEENVKIATNRKAVKHTTFLKPNEKLTRGKVITTKMLEPGQASKRVEKKKMFAVLKNKPRLLEDIRTFKETQKPVSGNTKLVEQLLSQPSQTYETHSLPQNKKILPVKEYYGKHNNTKVKHHHHHHHHNHVKEVVKKIPVGYPVEKIVHVPVEKIVERIVQIPKPYSVEKIVEKIVNVPVEKVVHVPKPYPVEKFVEKRVPYPVEKTVEKIIEKKVPFPVEKIVEKNIPFPVEKIVHVPIEKIVQNVVHVPKIIEKKLFFPVEKVVEKIVHVPKVVEKIVHVPVEKIVEKIVHVLKPYPVKHIINKTIHVPKPYLVIKPVPYPVAVKPVGYQVEKKDPVPYKGKIEKNAPVYDQHSYNFGEAPHQHLGYNTNSENENIPEHEVEHYKEEKSLNNHHQKSHDDISSFSPNDNIRHEEQTEPEPEKYAAKSQAISFAIPHELSSQQLRGFGYQKYPEQSSSGNKPLLLENTAPQSTPNFGVIADVLNAAGALRFIPAVSASGDLQSQESKNTLQHISPLQSIALPFQVFKLQPMTFQHTLQYAFPSDESTITDS